MQNNCLARDVGATTMRHSGGEMRKAILVALILFTVGIGGCSSNRFSPFPKFGGKIEGVAWCSSRYLDMVNEYQVIKPNGEVARKLKLASDGYIYALAATLTLQKENADQQYNFVRPSELELIPELSVDSWNGFQAETYKLNKGSIGNNEMIIAFRGSDQMFIDYVFQNFGIWQVQNKPAREYVHKAVAYRNAHSSEFGPKVVVTGNSLGGALAVHVTNNAETGGLITDAWVFNPSPRPGVSPPPNGNPKIRLLSTYSEQLNMFNRDKLGAQSQNTYTDFNLIESSAIYNHYRWILAREILWYADFGLYIESNKKAVDTPPLLILKQQHVRDANCELTEPKTQALRTAYNKKVEAAKSASKSPDPALGMIEASQLQGIDAKVLTE